MPRLPFVAIEPDEVNVVEVVAPIARVHAWATRQPPADASEPVRTLDGMTLYRIMVYDANELTCTVCGETSPDGWCWRCGKGFDPAKTPMVPTVSYLQPGEFEFIRRTW